MSNEKEYFQLVFITTDGDTVPCNWNFVKIYEKSPFEVSKEISDILHREDVEHEIFFLGCIDAMYMYIVITHEIPLEKLSFYKRYINGPGIGIITITIYDNRKLVTINTSFNSFDNNSKLCKYVENEYTRTLQEKNIIDEVEQHIQIIDRLRTRLRTSNTHSIIDDKRAYLDLIFKSIDKYL